MSMEPMDSRVAAPLFFTESSRSGKEVDSALKDVAERVQLNAPTMIFLTGTTTTGKSSIMAEFAKRYENAVELGADDFEMMRCAELIKQHCPDEYAILSQAIDDKLLYRLIFSPPIDVRKKPAFFFKPGISDAQKEALIALNESEAFFPKVQSVLKEHKASQDTAHFETILSYASKGKAVIFDTPNAQGFDAHLKNTSNHAPVTRILVYAPLTELVGRLAKRNQDAIDTGNTSNERQYIDILNQFKHLYRKAEPSDIRIDSLKRADLEKIFSDKREEIKRENSDQVKNNREEHVVDEEQYLQYFGLNSPDAEVAITPTYFQKFDGIFRTAVKTQTAAVSACQLASREWEKL